MASGLWQGLGERGHRSGGSGPHRRRDAARHPPLAIRRSPGRSGASGRGVRPASDGTGNGPSAWIAVPRPGRSARRRSCGRGGVPVHGDDRRAYRTTGPVPTLRHRPGGGQPGGAGRVSRTTARARLVTGPAPPGPPGQPGPPGPLGPPGQPRQHAEQRGPTGTPRSPAPPCARRARPGSPPLAPPRPPACGNSWHDARS